VEASDKLVPQTQVLARPDRLVIDFPNAIPGIALRNQSVNLGEVKDLRFGLFQTKPPVTRIVLDLKSAQSFQVFPYGRTVIIKVTGAATAQDASTAQPAYVSEPASRPGLIATNYTKRVESVRIDPPVIPETSAASVAATNTAVNNASAKPTLEVSFHDGMLAIRSNKATLSDVLHAVQQRTGAEVSISAGAEQEKVVANIGPAPAPEVLSQLLNGSKFNFLILNAANDPQRLDRIILTPRPDHVATANQPPVAQVMPIDVEADDPQPQPQPQTPPYPAAHNVPPPGTPPGAQQPPQPGQPDTQPDDPTTDK
jgi:antitoxin (DNA-binding transcriptional repressor) of toxin-antitoxin stability system